MRRGRIAGPRIGCVHLDGIISGEEFQRYQSRQASDEKSGARSFLVLSRRAWMVRILNFLERSGACARNVYVFIFGAVTYADGADSFAVNDKRKTAANRSLFRAASNGERKRKHDIGLTVSYERRA